VGHRFPFRRAVCLRMYVSGVSRVRICGVVALCTAALLGVTIVTVAEDLLLLARLILTRWRWRKASRVRRWRGGRGWLLL
jgi:hypothetical protein